MVLIPSWEQLVAGNLSDKLGAFWELVIGSGASARSLGIGWEPGSQKISLGAKKVAWEPSNCKRGSGVPTALMTAEYHDRGDVIPLSRQLEPVRIEPVKFHA